MESLTFPCEFPIKLFVKTPLDDFSQQLTNLLQAMGHTNPSIQRRASRSARYLALTVTIEAQSKAELDQVYQWLSQHERVIMAL